jgi:hypothetical protein
MPDTQDKKKYESIILLTVVIALRTHIRVSMCVRCNTITPEYQNRDITAKSL